MNALLVSLLVVAADPKPPEPKLPIGKDTTRVTGPIDKHGYIDYEAAVNDLLGKGVTAENNVNVLLWKAFGPKPEGSNMPPEYFKRLGIPEPAGGGDHFINTYRYAKDVLRIEQEDVNAIYDQQNAARNRPWTAKDYPEVAAWLKANEKPLALVLEATKRPKYFNPLVSKRGPDDSSQLIGCLLPSVQMCRELANALALRATLRLGEGKQAEAWDDVLACHRLARHLSHGGTLIELLVANAVHAIASNAAVVYAEHSGLKGHEYAGRLKELQALPSFAPVADKIDLTERLMGLDSVQLIRRGAFDGKKPTAEELKALDMIDWGAILKTMNGSYDKMAAAMRLRDRAAREKAFDELEADLEKRVKKTGSADLEKLIKEAGAGKVVADQLANVLMGLLAPAIRKVQAAADRTAQIENNLHVAFALAAYRADAGRYPAKLADLAPKYLTAVPGDVFSGGELIYKPSKDGYLFYSVGQNGKDDNGQWFGDDPPGDDPGVRVPRPLPKK
jgi:hypothetical protein